jgi:hypothetical protein
MERDRVGFRATGLCQRAWAEDSMVVSDPTISEKDNTSSPED